MGSRRIATAVLSLLKAATGVVCAIAGVIAGFLSMASPAAGQGFSSDAAQYAARAISVTGQVSVLRDNQEWAIEVGGEVRAKELIFTGPEGHAKFQVSDGSTFEVYPNARVVFRKNVPNWRDLLDVLVGRVKVHIQHWGDQPNHNRVLTPTAVISVRGTTFDISVDENDETTLVEVEEGTVEVEHALLPSGGPKAVNAGESLLVYRNQPIAASRFDKGEIAKRSLRVILQALSNFESRGHGAGTIGGGSPGGGDTGSGDTKKPPPPPPPPAPSAAGGFETGGPAIPAWGHSASSGPQGPLTGWQKFTHGAWHIAKRVIFGDTPEEQVHRAISHHQEMPF